MMRNGSLPFRDPVRYSLLIIASPVGTYAWSITLMRMVRTLSGRVLSTGGGGGEASPLNH